MSRPIQFLSILLVVTLLTSIGSHIVVRWLGVRTSSVSHRVTEREGDKTPAYVAGSSLLGGAMDVNKVCDALGQGMETWFVAGGSPSEWVKFQPRAPKANLTLIGISAYDLNEHYFCDVQANIVPLSDAIGNLIKSKSDWEFSKRVISQYPQRYLRILFPTIGRSGGVMGGVKEQMLKLIRPDDEVDLDAGPRVPTWGEAEVDPSTLEKISDWSPGYRLRRITKLKEACQGRHSYEGLKNLALGRLLNQARQQGRVIVIVLPVSETYSREFLDRETLRRFEDCLAKFQLERDEEIWVRLDRVSQLHSDDLYWDPVHLNVFGKKIATELLLAEVEKFFVVP